MSLFIKVSCAGRDDRYFAIRSLSTSFFEDEFGVLSTENSSGAPGQNPLFSVISAEDSYYLHFSPGSLPESIATRDGQGNLSPFFHELTPQELLRIDHELLFRLGDTEFVCLHTPELAAVLSEGFDSPEQAIAAPLLPRARLSITLAHTTKSLPLIEGASITVGSHEHDTITLPLDGIAERHLVLTQGEDHTTIRSAGGAFRIVTGDTLGSTSIVNSPSESPTECQIIEGEIQLIPSQVLLKIAKVAQ